MGTQTSDQYNRDIKTGFTAQSGPRWWFSEEKDYQWNISQGRHSSHYEGAIPVEDIRNDLFAWSAEKIDVFGRLYVAEDAEHFDGADENGPYVNIPAPESAMIVRSDTHKVLGIHSDSFNNKDYNDTLLSLMLDMVGEYGMSEGFGISNAGLLDDGKKAWLEYQMQDSILDPNSGLSFRPYLLGFSSLDGSLRSGVKTAVNVSVCDNTLHCNLNDGSRKITAKRSKFFNIDADAAAEALGMLRSTGDSFLRELELLANTAVADKQFWQVMDIINPLPADEGRGKTRMSNKRDKLATMYSHDMRVAPWKDTALGVVQLFNTYGQHESEVRGTGSRVEKNQLAVMTGKTEEADRKVFGALDMVLDGALTAV